MQIKSIGRKQEQAGHRYEHAVAWTLRKEGWDVEETGRNGIHDHGIDLIATKEGRKMYVQCKGWKRWRRIHEDVISQLVGSVAGIEGFENVQFVEMALYSPAKLGDYAAEEAQRLNVQFVRMHYPRRHNTSV
jgi:HJR/Mrr/RecB family endonuclease